ncbi:murein biosynthesis integral membrane protein MurJ [Priestia filamentosa]|uniref:murein biosynthesis integral membrane protein MurJ n=1 Tax=Priestia filamentosa TaxID=1402861 RepID=UPI001C1E1114|nr:murein biosynthesis integral membrane protein MurJ [Priestia filamentosa]
MSKKSLLAVIGVVALLNILSRFFGFFREAVIGYQFGTSDKADSIVLAYTIPMFLYTVLGGAITTAFISIYKKMTKEDEKRQFQEVLFTYTCIGMAFLSLLLVVFAGPIVQVLFPGLSAKTEETTVYLFRWMAPSSLFLVLSMWLTGILNIYNRFFMPACSTLANNAGFVVLVLILYPFLGIDAYNVGALTGAIVMCILLAIEIKKYNIMTFRFRLNMKDGAYVQRFFRMMIPILLGGATLQFYFLIQRMFASDLSEGVIAALNYASKLVQLPQVVLMTAVTTVIYPKLAGEASKGNSEGVNLMYEKGLKALLLCIGGATIFVYVYAHEIIESVFQYGSFTEDSTMLTATLLKWFVIGMFAHGANVYVTRFFYALERPFFPVVSGVIAVFVINVSLIYLFMESMGASGVALATTISAFVQFIALIIVGKGKLGLSIRSSLLSGSIWSFLLLLTVVTVLIGWGLPLENSIGRLIIGGILFVITVLLAGAVTKIPEISSLFNKLKRKGIK